MKAALISGGKDSMLALHKAIDSGIKIDLLITIISKNEFSYMFHRPNAELTSLQAEALGIRHIFGYTSGEKELELDDLERILVDNNVDLLVTGAIESRYQKDRIDSICKRHNIDSYAPLWHIDPLEELNELSDRFNVIITQVSAMGLDESFLGKRIDKLMINRLLEVHKKYKINLLFEGGEAESFVLDAPLFKKRIKIEKAHIEKRGDASIYKIDSAILESKD
ncbi:MAG: TIGR00289 family protein [Candidatus Micrarchaeota archaeon]|nr:MAG: TIGR00289 family protein [Candidatus Micrarchaeota archaeon]